MSETDRPEVTRVKTFYDSHPERDRLRHSTGKLEFERTKDIIARHLRGSADILDVGGGTGIYAFWLASLDHRVTLVDLSGVHVQIARELDAVACRKLAGTYQASALDLPFKASHFDAVLNMGPMYHLSPLERQKALSEIKRVLRPGGLMFSAYISRFASLLDGYNEGYIEDPLYLPMALSAVTEGRHNPQVDGKYFTLAYMHRPEEVGPELKAAGFRVLDLLAVEGPFWAHPKIDGYVDDIERFKELLATVRLLEREPSILGASAHFLAVSATPE
jgi:SAM-dependent methyltransferase